VNYTRRAERQIDKLTERYEEQGRDAALVNLRRAIREAESRIEKAPDDGASAPRPYPELAQPGMAWIKAGRYWFRYTITQPLTITAIVFDTSDIVAHI
jgi:plasmid stabilization system protein ParE